MKQKKNIEMESNKDKVEIDNNIEKENKKDNKILHIIKELIPYVVILIIVVLFRTYVATFVMVSGPSMNPTLDSGDILVLNKTKNIDRLDIIVARVVINGKSEEIIKRVIAMPGDTIVCENGMVYVNGRKIDEDYIEGNNKDFDLVTVAEDEYFVMGDNRAVSADSREIGPVGIDSIKGKVSLAVFPFNKLGKIEDREEVLD